MKTIIKKINVFLLLSLILSLPLFTIADTNTVYLRSADDFKAFVKNCTLDSYSAGKTFLLTKDIKLSGFLPVPVFSGTFDGNNHTVSGVVSYKNASKTGLFRNVSAGAVIKNLTVETTLIPGGSSSKIGAVAGINSGTITNCKFKGEIKGLSYIGGISGQNEGTISGCTSEGSIYGKHYVGGITGRNLGTVVSCVNKSKVNTKIEKTTFDIENIDLSNIISTENTVEITDIGGISGFSSGITESCENRGTVGYVHVGYNVGGIAGRQNGYLSGCKNYGEVYGRKDVGGIVGQLEPFTVLQYSESSVLSLSDDLNTLEKMIDELIGESDSMRSGVSARLSGIKTQTNTAIELTDTLVDMVNGNLETNADNITDTSARITSLIGSVTDTMGKYGYIDENSAEIVNDVAGDLVKAADEYNDAISSVSGEVNSPGLKKSADKLKEATRDLNGAASSLRSSARDLKTFMANINAASKAIDNIKKSLDNMIKGEDEVSSAAKETASELAKIREGIASGKIPAGSDISALVSSLEKTFTSVSEISAGTKSDYEQLKTAFEQLASALKAIDGGDIASGVDKLATAAGYAADSTRNLRDAVNSLETAFDGFNIDTKGLTLDDAGTKIQKNAESITGILLSLGKMFDELNGSIIEFNANPIINIERFPSEMYETKDALSGSISGITDSFEALNNYASGTLGGIGGTLGNVNNQLFKVLDSLSSVIESATTDVTEKTIDDLTMDISEEDTAAQTTGKITGCKNDGDIDGDINVGGIVGSLAIEYDFDPEDDISRNGKRSFDFIYKTRAVVRQCRNSANIKSKKNCVGGIAGQMKLGCIINCAAGGYIESKTGDYVGGIAGDCKTTIKNCTARVSLSGDDYVGGIAGNANHIYDCGSVVTIDKSDEFSGGIAGNTEGLCRSNFYAGNVTGAVDGTSYSGIAEEGSVDFIKETENGDIFDKFTAKFIIDGKTVKEMSFGYGETLKDIPSIPEKEGYYAKWDTESFENLSRDITAVAVYVPYVTSVETDKTRKSGLPIALCEGKYTEETTAKIEKEKTKRFSGKREENWKVTVSDAPDGGEMTIHYLPSDNMRFEQAVYVLKDGKYVRTSCKKDGKYLVFKGTKGSTVFGVSPAGVKPGKLTFIIIIILIFSSVLKVGKKVKNKEKTPV